MKMISRYTPCAVCSGNIVNKIYSVDFGKLATSADVVEVTGASTAKVFDWEKPIEIDAPFGACLSVVASGASSSVITIDGFDYLGQPMTETVTLNGTTAVAGNKCFKYISKVSTPASTAVTVSITRKLKLGLPFRTVKILSEERDGVVSTTGVLVAPTTSASTATSNDPRGTFNLTTYAAAAHVVAVLVASDEVFTINSKEQGGIFGIPQYSA